MSCNICGVDAEGTTYYVLPLVSPGIRECRTCELCAKKSDQYCRNHDLLHVGFMDKTTACTKCIDELVESKKEQGQAIAEKLFSRLPEDVARELYDEAESLVGIIERTVHDQILRFIATKAVRMKQSVEDVLEQVIKDQSAKYILGWS